MPACVRNKACCSTLFLRSIKITQVFIGLGDGGSVTLGARLASLQNTENEANSLLPLGFQKLKGFQLQGALLLVLDQGLCPLIPRGELTKAVCAPYV